MNRCIFTLFLFLFSFSLFGQNAPLWIDARSRDIFYPKEEYLVGFAAGDIFSGESKETAMNRIKKESQGDLIQGIRVKIESETQHITKSTRINDSEQINAVFQSAVKTIANMEIVGITTDSYCDGNTIYAISYVDRKELSDYYQANLKLSKQQIKNIIRVSAQFEADNEKALARNELKKAVPLFDEISKSQALLIALNKNMDDSGLEELMGLQNQITQGLARFRQGIYVYIENEESILGEKSDMITHRIQAQLSDNGCSFTDVFFDADLVLIIRSNTRKHGAENAPFAFCYADVVVELIKIKTGKTIYKDEFSQKGGAGDHYTAARKACEDIAPKIADNVIRYINE
ncbi:hypothetical protein LJB78_01025 [Bacteroidales bacterium OttesenSCG-928-J16]|nr:hypothetical protein [Bacteroidales bacterium OttesenSCG-928-J16]